MTADKIRSASQMLLEAHDSIAPLREMSSGWDQLRTALAEPAQAAPAADAVPVVACVWDPFAGGNIPCVLQSDHLAAMEAMRQQLADSQAELKLLADEMVYRGNSVSFIYDKAQARGKAIDDVFAALKAHGVRSDGNTHVAELVRTAFDALRQENERLKAENFALSAGQCVVPGGLCGDEGGNQYCSLKADRSAQVADVMRLVDAYGEQCESGRVSSPAMLAIEAAVRELAGGA